MNTHLDRICSNCGLTFGAHRADSIVKDQCPMNEGRMNWPTVGVTTFVDSGIVQEVAYDTASNLFPDRS